LIATAFEAMALVQSASASLAAIASATSGLPGQVDTLRRDITLEVRSTRKEALRQVDLLRRDFTALSDEAEADAASILDSRIAEVTRTLDARSEEIGGTLRRIDSIVTQAQETSDLLLACEANPQCFANRSIGTLQAIEKAAQAGERAARSVDAALPPILADVQQATDASVQASQSTAGLMSNLEKQSKPLPLALRFAPQAVQAILLGIGVLK
jgi:hypothetical protein